MTRWCATTVRFRSSYGVRGERHSETQDGKAQVSGVLVGSAGCRESAAAVSDRRRRGASAGAGEGVGLTGGWFGLPSPVMGLQDSPSRASYAGRSEMARGRVCEGRSNGVEKRFSSTLYRAVPSPEIKGHENLTEHLTAHLPARLTWHLTPHLTE